MILNITSDNILKQIMPPIARDSLRAAILKNAVIALIEEEEV
jgi:hypothetical protein